MIVRYARNYADGRTARGEIEFGPPGEATITGAADKHIMDALDAVLNAAIEYEPGEYRAAWVAVHPCARRTLHPRAYPLYGESADAKG